MTSIKIKSTVILCLLVLTSCSKEQDITQNNQDLATAIINYKNTSFGSSSSVVLNVNEYDNLVVLVQKDLPSEFLSPILSAVDNWGSIDCIGISFCVYKEQDDGSYNKLMGHNCEGTYDILNDPPPFFTFKYDPDDLVLQYEYGLGEYTFGNPLVDLSPWNNDAEYLAAHHIGHSLGFGFSNWWFFTLDPENPQFYDLNEYYSISTGLDESALHHVCGCPIATNESVMFHKIQLGPLDSGGYYQFSDHFYGGEISQEQANITASDERLALKMYPSQDCYVEPNLVCHSNFEADSSPGDGSEGQFYSLNVFASEIDENAYWGEFRIYAIPDAEDEQTVECTSLLDLPLASRDFKIGELMTPPSNSEILHDYFDECTKHNSLSVGVRKYDGVCNNSNSDSDVKPVRGEYRQISQLRIELAILNLKKDVSVTKEIIVDLPWSMGCCADAVENIVYAHTYAGGTPVPADYCD